MAKNPNKKTDRKPKKAKGTSATTIEIKAGQSVLIKVDGFADPHFIHIEHIIVVSPNQVNFDGSYVGVDKTTLRGKLFRMSDSALLGDINPMRKDNPSTGRFSESFVGLNLAAGMYAIMVSANSTAGGALNDGGTFTIP